ncbi:polyhydroxyalkanoate synthesis regulator DNA-binding domain-containing protein [Thermodesulfobacteriota bacterium]
MDKKRIKKYPNRRLYDTEKSTYISLAEVADLIRNGQQVEVIDTSDNEDITSLILTQIILEEARSRNVLLPASLLHLIIQYGEDLLRDFFDHYLEQTLKGFIAYKTAFDEQFNSWLKMGIDLSHLTEETAASMKPLASAAPLLFPDPSTGNKSGAAEE